MRPPNDRGRAVGPDLQDAGSPAASSTHDATWGQGHAQATLDEALTPMGANPQLDEALSGTPESPQPVLYTAQLASNGREHGLATAERNDTEWTERVFDWIERLEPGVELDADIVRTEFGPSMAVGSVFRRASRAGLIACIGITTSRAVTRHKGVTRRWVRT